MSKQYGNRIISMAIVIMMVIGFLTVTNMNNVQAAEPEGPVILSDPVTRINNNTDLNAAAGSGTGVWNDPYILTYADLNASGHGYGLFIGNTTDHFILQNSVIYGTDIIHSFPWNISAGIHLHNVRNAQIINCTIYEVQTYGIAITNNSYNFTIEYCTIWDFERGISVDNANLGIFDNNRIYGNTTGNFGLVFNTLSDEHTIRNNIIEDCNWFGIAYNDSWNVVMENNTVTGVNKDNSFCGIGAYNSKYIELRNNSVSDVYTSIVLYNTTTIPLRESQIDLYNNTISECYYGIEILEVYEIGVFGGSIDAIEYGIYIYDCEDIIINDVEFANMETGIDMAGIINITVSECIFTNLSVTGIRMEDCIESLISQCIITDTIVGIDALNIEIFEILYSEFTNVETCMAIDTGLSIDILNNAFENNTMVFVMVDTDIIEISNNTFTNNTGGAIGMNQCSDVTITSNNFTDSGETLGAITLDTVINVTMIYNDFVNAEFRHVTFNNVTNATSFGNYFYTSEYGDAWDNVNNTWNHSTLGGNYWCNYTGEDTDGDGFGETPYNISGGTNQDMMPITSNYNPPTAMEELSTMLMALLFQLMLPLIVIMVVIGMIGSILNPKKGKKSKK